MTLLLKKFLLKPVCYTLPSFGCRKRLLSQESIDRYKALKITEVKPFVYSVELDRPKKLNAISNLMWEEIGTAFKELGDDPDCRAIILSGSGRMFSAGIDLTDLAKLSTILTEETDAARKAKALYPFIVKLQNSVSEIERCPKPVIAAVHNACVGGGVDVICAVDIRYCTKDSYFQVKEVDIGLAADLGTLQRLPRIIGSASLARELCFTARKMESAEALSSGFVSKISEDKESMMKEAFELAEAIAKKSPVAVQGTKINLIYGRDHPVSESLEYEARWNSTMVQCDDLMAATMAQISKSEEPPTFSKL